MRLMRTTVDIPDELLRRAKSEAALRGRKLKDLVEEGLRLVLEEPKVPASNREDNPSRPGPARCTKKGRLSAGLSRTARRISRPTKNISMVLVFDGFGK